MGLHWWCVIYVHYVKEYMEYVDVFKNFSDFVYGPRRNFILQISFGVILVVDQVSCLKGLRTHERDSLGERTTVFIDVGTENIGKVATKRKIERVKFRIRYIKSKRKLDIHLSLNAHRKMGRKM